jgi:hypothetical protein
MAKLYDTQDQEGSVSMNNALTDRIWDSVSGIRDGKIREVHLYDVRTGEGHGCVLRNRGEVIYARSA